MWSLKYTGLADESLDVEPIRVRNKGWLIRLWWGIADYLKEEKQFEEKM